MKPWRWVAVVVVSGLAACGGDALASMAFKDAGGLARDAAQVLDALAGRLADAGRDTGSIAKADDVLDVACDKEYTWSQTSGTSTTTFSFWMAEIEAKTDAITGIDVRACDRETLGTTDNSGFTCASAPGAPCTGTGRPPMAPCIVGLSAELEPDLIRVTCGNRQRSVIDSYVSDVGYRYNSVKLTIRH